MENKTKNESLLELIYLIRKSFPRNNLYYFSYFLFKFLGIILSTNNIRNFESKINNITSIHSILKKITIFDSSFKLIDSNYQLISLIIFLICIGIIIYYSIVYLQLKSSFRDSKTLIKYETNKLLSMSDNIEIYIRIITYLVLIVNFFSELICEYLSFGIISPIIKNIITNSSNIERKNIKYIQNYFSNNIFSVKITMILNIFSFIILYFIEYLFLRLNNIYCLFSSFGIPLYYSRRQDIFILIFIFFQPIYGYTYIFNELKRSKIRLIICIILVSFLSFFIISNIKRYCFYSSSIVPIYNLGIIIFCWYSGIIEIILYYIIKSQEKMTQGFSILKLITSIGTSLLILSIILYKNKQYYSYLFSVNLFNTEEKNTHVGEIYEFICAYSKFRNTNFTNIDEVYELINTHKQKCILSNCICNSLFKTISLTNQNQSEIMNEQLLIIGEQEITNRIFNLYKTRKFTQILQDYCIIHVQYIYSISNKIYLSLYFANKYLQYSNKMKFLTNYYFYEIKKIILGKIFYEKVLVEKKYYNNETLINKKRQQFIMKHLNTFLTFSIVNEIIKKLLLNNFENLEIVFSFRKKMNKNLKFSSLNQKTFNKFLLSCNIIKGNDEKLQNILTNYLKGRVLRNCEICYLLTNYFFLIHHQIPEKLEGAFDQHYQYSSIINEIDEDEKEFNMKYPMIITLSNSSDTFLISYINNIFREALGYSKSKIIQKDFHEMIPFEIKEAHNYIMKQFLFIPNPSFTKRSFILDSEKYLVNCFFECRILPNFHNSFHIIINYKLTSNDNENLLIYSVFLDQKFSFISLCRDFEQLFFFNMKMFEILHLNFCEFFGLNESFLSSKLKKENMNLGPNLKKEDKALSIFSNVPQEKMFKFRSMKNSIKNLQKNSRVYKQYIEKKQILEGLSNLIKTIYEIGLDIEWYQRVKCLGERLKIAPPNHSFIKDTSPNYKGKHSKSFEATFYSKIIGHIPYYIVKIKEKTTAKDLAERTSDIIKNILPINRRYSYFNPIINSSMIEENFTYENNNDDKNANMNNYLSPQKKSNFKREIKTELFSPKSPMTPLPSPKKGLRFLENLNNINILDLNNSNSFQNSKVGLLNNNSLSINYLNKNNTNNFSNNNNEIKLVQSTRRNEEPKQDLTDITIIKGFKPLESKELINEQLIKKIFSVNENLPKRSQILNKIIIYIYFIIIILAFILEIIKRKKLKKHKNLFTCNVYLERVKTGIYLSSLIILRECFLISTKKEENSKFKSLIAWKLKKLRENSNEFISFIHSLSSNRGMNNIFNLLYKQNIYNIVGFNWDFLERNSSFFEEISLYQYLLSKIYYEENDLCNIEFFYNENYLNFDGKIIPPSNFEKLNFYNIYNVIQNLKYIFQELSFLSSKILLDFYSDFLIIILFFSVAIIILSLIVFVFHWKSLMDDKKIIKYILLHLFKVSSGKDYFEEQVKYFKLILEEFNGKNIYIFENNKEKEIKMLFEEKKRKKRMSRNPKRISKKETNSRNSSSLNNNKILNIYPKESKIDDIEKNDGYSQQKFFLPNFFVFSLIIVVICFIFMNVILIIDIFYTIKIKDGFSYSFSVSMNFLERIPKVLELVYYAEISSIINKVDFIPRNSFFPNEDFLNYYKVNIYPEENSQLKFLENSFYYILYVQGTILESNIKIFIGENKQVLKKLKELEYSLNIKNNLCDIAANTSIDKNENASIGNGFFTDPEIRRNECKTNCGSLNENGLMIELDFIYQELTNLYYDYVKNNTIIKGVEIISSDDLNRINNDCIHAFIYIFESYSKIIIEEVEKNHNNIKKNGFLISYSFIILVFLIIGVYSLFVLKKMDEYENILIFFYKMY